MATATVRVARDRGRDRRPYAIVVDGAQVGELGRGETEDVAVDPGRHQVWVAVQPAHSRGWEVSLQSGDTVSFVCRSAAKKSGGRVDLFLAEPDDRQARLLPPEGEADRDLARHQQVLTPDGQVLSVWAHKSGYFRSLDPGAGGGGSDAFLVELALYILVLPVLGVLRWVRHRLVFKRGWSVGVVRARRFLWPKKVRLERFGTEAEARAGAARLIAELEGRSAP